MKKIVKYISFAFILLWILGVAYRIWFDTSSGQFISQQTYTILDGITDGSLILGIIGFIVSAIIKKPTGSKTE